MTPDDRKETADRANEAKGIREGAPLDGAAADNPAHPKTPEQSPPASEAGSSASPE